MFFGYLQVKASEEAIILCMTCAAMMKLKMNDLEGTKVSIYRLKENWFILEGECTNHSRMKIFYCEITYVQS